MPPIRSPKPIAHTRTALEEIYLNEAVQTAAESGKVREAARKFGVPRTTIRRRIKGGKTRAEAHASQQLLSPAEEQLLLEAGDRAVDAGFGWDVGLLRSHAEAICRRKGVHPPGKRWPDNFLARHPDYKKVWAQGLDRQRLAAQHPDRIALFYNLVSSPPSLRPSLRPYLRSLSSRLSPTHPIHILLARDQARHPT